MPAEFRNDPVIDLGPVRAVNGALGHAQRRDVVNVGAHPFGDGGHLTGLARLSGVALGFELANLAGHLPFGRALPVPPVWAAVLLDAHGYPAMPPTVLALIDR